MNEREKNDPLRELGDRLDKARATYQPAPANKPGEGTGAALAFGWRIGIELLGAIAVSVFIGWAFDRWLGTRPWGMVIFFFLGIATGMVNVYRAVKGLGMAIGYRKDGQAKGSALNWDDDED
jgi:ATP synthase protein I